MKCHPCDESLSLKLENILETSILLFPYIFSIACFPRVTQRMKDSECSQDWFVNTSTEYTNLEKKKPKIQPQCLWHLFPK